MSAPPSNKIWLHICVRWHTQCTAHTHMYRFCNVWIHEHTGYHDPVSPVINLQVPYMTVLLAGQLTSHGSVPNMNKRFFCSSKCTNLLWGLLPSYSTGIDCSFAGPQHETDHSHPPSVYVKNECSYTASPPYAIITCIWTVLPLWNTHNSSMDLFSW